MRNFAASLMVFHADNDGGVELSKCAKSHVTIKGYLSISEDLGLHLSKISMASKISLGSNDFSDRLNP